MRGLKTPRRGDDVLVQAIRMLTTYEKAARVSAASDGLSSASYQDGRAHAFESAIELLRGLK